MGGVTSDQREFRVFARTQDADIVGFDNSSRPHDVMEVLSAAENVNIISVLQAVYVPEKSVPVAGKYGVAPGTGSGRASQMSRSEQ